MREGGGGGHLVGRFRLGPGRAIQNHHGGGGSMRSRHLD